MTFSDLAGNFHYGMHGCGFYKGAYHANAKEALDYWRKSGIELMEIDIAQTKDHKYVGLAHIMNEQHLNMVEIQNSATEEDAFSESWFMRKKLCEKTTGGLTPMNLVQIVELLKRDSKLFVMFDLWGLWSFDGARDFSNQLCKLFKGYGYENRFIIEAYNSKMIEGIRSVDKCFNIIYCVHSFKRPEIEETTPLRLKELGISVISFPWVYTKEYPGELEKYHKEGFVIFSVSRDNRDSKEMIKLGVNVNLVDILYRPSNILYIIYERIKTKAMRNFRKLVYN